MQGCGKHTQSIRRVSLLSSVLTLPWLAATSLILSFHHKPRNCAPRRLPRTALIRKWRCFCNRALPGSACRERQFCCRLRAAGEARAYLCFELNLIKHPNLRLMEFSQQFRLELFHGATAWALRLRSQPVDKWPRGAPRRVGNSSWPRLYASPEVLNLPK